LIAGLGNPGPKYGDTRHNLGFKVIRRLGKTSGVSLTKRSFHSRNTKTTIEGREVILLCPMTFMNLSGLAVKACVDHFGLETKDVLVVHDDIDLPLGKLRAVKGGGAGGHKGVLSIIHHLGSQEFPRLKVGIGRPGNGQAVEDYVLSPFCKEEERTVERVLQVAVEACRLFLSSGIESTMNVINGQNLAIEEVRN